VGGSGDLRDVTHQRHILRGGIELPSGDDGGYGFSAGGVVFRDIGLLVQPALDDFRGVLKVLAQLLFG